MHDCGPKSAITWSEKLQCRRCNPGQKYSNRGYLTLNITTKAQYPSLSKVAESGPAQVEKSSDKSTRLQLKGYDGVIGLVSHDSVVVEYLEIPCWIGLRAREHARR